VIASLALLVALPLAANAAAGGSRGAVVTVAKVGGLGQVIVDSKRMRLYDLHKDKGKISSCYGQCAEAWPPLLTNGSPKAMGGAKSSVLGTTKRKDGTTQVTYKGHPLYGFVKDKKPGESNGNGVNGFGGLWFAPHPQPKSTTREAARLFGADQRTREPPRPASHAGSRRSGRQDLNLRPLGPQLVYSTALCVQTRPRRPRVPAPEL
jgi:predicted lipoprotein with Yx(FWY)xxD motif